MMHVYDKFPALYGKDPDKRSRRYILPKRIVWTSAEEGASVTGADHLLLPKEEQISFGTDHLCVLKNTPGQPKAAVLLDYGIEMNGSARLMIRNVVSNHKNRADLRLRFGESVMEAMTDLGVKNTTNDHADRDMVLNAGFLSAMETNETGFRFLRVDLLDDEAEVAFKSIEAVFIFRDLPYLGSFDCSDERLTRIWNTAAYTAHLNMQEYLWDGVKRDRLVWIGDMHTEVMTILSVFGKTDVVPKSLDLAKADAPIADGSVQWMNGMPAYSLWWLLIHYDWYMGTGDSDYLAQQKDYMCRLLAHLCTLVGEDGAEQMPVKFLDWPTCGNASAQHAGMQGLLRLALLRGAALLEQLGETDISADCRAAATRMKAHVPQTGDSKPAGALLVLGGLADPKQMNNTLISVGGGHGFSTFLGYYILKAKAEAGDYDGALDSMKEYWGGMLDMGATTFWEDFNLDWMKNAAPIDAPIPEGKDDIHGDFGAHCYVKFRHSLCHGWSSGPCPYLTHVVLGIQPAAPGCSKLRISPHLGSLTEASGTYPTPFGIVTVRHTKNADGTVHSDISAPKEIEILR